MPPAPPTSILPWGLAAAGASALVALAVLPALADGGAVRVVSEAFGLVCHQLPERSPHLHGSPVALCHRCFGVAAGFAAGLAAAPALGLRALARAARGAQPAWLAVALFPTALDWLVGALGVWANTPVSRTLTGALFGVVAGVVLASNLLTPPPAAPSRLPAFAPDAQ